jgi:hypothetical protein
VNQEQLHDPKVMEFRGKEQWSHFILSAKVREAMVWLVLERDDLCSSIHISAVLFTVTITITEGERMGAIPLSQVIQLLIGDQSDTHNAME